MAHAARSVVLAACLLALWGTAAPAAAQTRDGPPITPEAREALSTVVRAERAVRRDVPAIEMALEIRALRGLLLDLVHAIARGEGGSQASLLEASGARITTLLGALHQESIQRGAEATVDFAAMDERAARLRDEIDGIVGAPDDAERVRRALALFTALDSQDGRRLHRLERPPVPTVRGLPVHDFLGEGR